MLQMLIAEHYLYGQVLFVKLLGICFLAAFISLSQQALGLFGARGIMPLDDFMHIAKQKIKDQRYAILPTVFWYSCTDKMIRACILGGIISSFCVILNVVPALFLLILCLLYLSFINIGSPFLSYQWDSLLVEVGFLGFLMSLQSPPPVMLVVATWLIFFRFIFSSGIVKMLSGCPEWRSLTAMQYHFETQPLPNKGGYFCHQLVQRFVKPTTIGVFFLELVVPFFVFFGSLGRLWAALLSILLQIFILVTGNYAFFNLLTIALCFPLISDTYLNWLPLFSLNALRPDLFLSLILNLLGVGLILLNTFVFLRLFFRLTALDKIYRWIAPWHIVNPYGLFAVMTTKRNEVILEGSNDGIVWEPYEFYWKPGALEHPPRQIAPLQPRLDWQMWFAALDHYQNIPWLHQLIMRMLHGSTDVMALFKHNPFRDRPPRFIRALLFQYRFTSLEEKRETGRWWKREFRGFYAPPFSLRAEEDISE
ncbi:MAG: lipase maturation factor family protein [Parachlamydiaceae bacterium]